MKKNFLITFVLFLAFSTFSEVKAQALLKDDKIPEDLLITLVRSFFWQESPDYKLVIKFDGTITFDVRHYSENKKVTRKISQSQLRKLIVEFEKADFFNLRDTYYQEKDGCTEMWTDNPLEGISIQINGQSKKVFHDFGCRKVSGNPTETVERLGKKIDEIVETKRWIGEIK